LNFNQNQKKLNNEKYIEENYKVPFINSNNFHNKKTDIKIDNKKSLSYSMLPNNEKQNPNNDLDNWDLSKNIPSTTKEMFQNYFNNLKDPQSYNYFHYKLFDVNGEEISNLSSYQNITKINLFKNEESSKSDKDSDSNSNSNSNSNNTNKTNKNKSSSSSQKTKNNNSSSSNNKTISKNSNSDSNNSNKSNSHHSNNSRDGSDSNSLKNSGSNSDSNSGSGKNSNSNQNSGSDSNQNSKESKTPSNNYKYSKKHHIKSKSDSFISSCSDLINYNKDSE
jgi:E3 ubiquitin-protein ligase HUWE1